MKKRYVILCAVVLVCIAGTAIFLGTKRSALPEQEVAQIQDTIEQATLLTTYAEKFVPELITTEPIDEKTAANIVADYTEAIHAYYAKDSFATSKYPSNMERRIESGMIAITVDAGFFDTTIRNIKENEDGTISVDATLTTWTKWVDGAEDGSYVGRIIVNKETKTVIMAKEDNTWKVLNHENFQLEITPQDYDCEKFTRTCSSFEEALKFVTETTPENCFDA